MQKNPKQTKQNKTIDEEKIPIAWYQTRVWDWCMTKGEKLWNDKSNASNVSSIEDQYY